MRVRCRAVADPRSNALGTLELEATPEGLWVVYQSVRSYREGYAPGPTALATEHRAPWSAVRATRVGAEHLRLEVQEPLSPFAHFYLRDFARAEPLPWVARARPWAGLAASQVVLTDFCHTLSQHLESPVATELSAPAALGTPRALRRFPRAAAACAILFTACTLAALMLGKATSFSTFVDERASAPLLPGTTSAAAPPGLQRPRTLQPASPPAPRASPPAPPAPALGPGCECVRHESALWERPPPRLTVLVSEQRLEPHGTHQHLALTLALVNNGDRELSNLSLSVRIQGASPGPPGSDDAPVERIGYFPGPLAPGHQLRWTAKARGDRFELRAPDLGRLDEDGIDAAPADAFLKLAAAGKGPVSLHAGLMLAFLGDARARQTLLGLRAGRSADEQALLTHALESTTDLRVCQLRVSERGTESRLQCCVYNAGDRPQADFELELRELRGAAASGSPGAAAASVLARQVIDWPGALPPRRGRRLELTLDPARGDAAPGRRIELVAREKEELQ